MIAPDDKRHGSHAGYIAGCHEECCSRPRLRAQKERRLYALANGTGCVVAHDKFRAAIDPWLRMGISPYELEEASGVGSRISDILRDETSVLRGTFASVCAITEADIADGAKVYADLTRARVDSLMAIGHRLSDMPINSRGHWRKREMISVRTARVIRDYYAAHEFIVGADRHTQSRALNRGALPPLAWDDPGALAWPTGVAPKRSARVRTTKDDLDPVVVQRVLAGDRLPMTTAERREVVVRARGLGWSEEEIRVRTGIAKATDAARYGVAS